MDTKVPNNSAITRLVLCPFRKVGDKDFEQKVCEVTIKADAMSEYNLVRVIDKTTELDIVGSMDSCSKQMTLQNIMKFVKES